MILLKAITAMLRSLVFGCHRRLDGRGKRRVQETGTGRPVPLHLVQRYRCATLLSGGSDVMVGRTSGIVSAAAARPLSQ